ncbi:hypothetical protein L218DRAFT_987332 [Marasmius fiardii PR-910]|nr:hypothetical protein L218DRAFT_987332 [Marasmius fiardii PR-910]
MKEARRPILCENCQRATDIPHIRHFPDLEPRFLRFDYIPSELERPQLNSILNEGEQLAKRYEEDISILRQKIDQLEKARIAVEITNRNCRAALSVQRRVPVEIWEIIFSTVCLTLHEYSFDMGYPAPNATALELPAFIVSQVSSHWRTIANGMPSLWSSISVNIDEPAYPVTTPLKTYLLKSESCPLKLRIAGGKTTLTSRGLDAWQTLSGYIYRSQKLIMAMKLNHGFLDALPPIPHLTFPYLESYHEKSLVLVLASLPDGTQTLDVWDTGNIIWPGDLIRFFGLARDCRHLNYLHIRPYVMNDNNDASVVVPSLEVELPALRRLVVHAGLFDDSLSILLGSLIMPSLEECKIRCYDWPEPSSLLFLARRSSASLKRMEINLRSDKFGNIPSRTILLDFLQHVQSLTHFTLLLETIHEEYWQDYHFSFSDMTLTLFSKLKDDSPAFLPKLEFLSLVIPDTTPNTEHLKLMLEIVSARQLTSHPLRDFRLVCVRSQSGEDFVLEPEMVERIRFLEESRRIKVVIEDRVEGFCRTTTLSCSII